MRDEAAGKSSPSGIRFPRFDRLRRGLSVMIHSSRHFGVHLEQLFQPLRVVPEPAADVDALQRLIVLLMRFA
jgi:hypothetical protein